MRFRLVLIVAWLGLVLPDNAVAQNAPPPAVVKTTQDQQDPTKFHVEVTLNVGREFRDVHCTALSGMAFPSFEGGTNPDVTVTNPSEGPGDPTTSQTWKAKQTGGQTQIHVYADDANEGFVVQPGQQPETFRFTLDFNDNSQGEAPLDTVGWKVTDDGKIKPGENAVIGHSGQVSANEARLPQKERTRSRGGQRLGTIGTSEPITVETDPMHVGWRFTLYAAVQYDEECNDPTGIGVNPDLHPLPQQWGIELTDPAGVITPQGEGSPSPRLVVPNNPALVGETFYIVVALRIEGQPEILAWSEPLFIEVQAP